MLGKKPSECKIAPAILRDINPCGFAIFLSKRYFLTGSDMPCGALIGFISYRAEHR